MRALVIEHDHVSPPGPVADALRSRGYEVVEHLVVEEEDFPTPTLANPMPSLTGVDLIVPMGAPWHAYDADLRAAWVDAELDLLRAADADGIPVLGICFGGQLLAMAHGGTVGVARAGELGWVDIETAQPDLVAAGPWFQWHGDGWEVPPGATELAHNAAASQSFVLRRNLAVQFHPELTEAMLQGWLDNGGDSIARDHGHDPAELLAQTRAEEPAARERAFALVNAFLDQVATA